LLQSFDLEAGCQAISLQAFAKAGVRFLAQAVQAEHGPVVAREGASRLDVRAADSAADSERLPAVLGPKVLANALVTDAQLLPDGAQAEAFGS
jgi:hypothetical protein